MDGSSTKPNMRIFGVVVLVVIFGVLGWVVFHNTVRYDLFPKRFVELEEARLFRSGQLSRTLVREVFIEHDIGVVVDLAEYEPKFAADKREEERVAAGLGIQYSRFPLKGDGTGDVRQYALAIAAIDRANKNNKAVLVHCAAGARRTAGVIAAYYVLVRGTSTEVAYGEIERFGSASGRSKITDYLNAHMLTLSQLLVDMNVIDRHPVPMPVFEGRG